MRPVELLPSQPITAEGDRPSQELVEIIQRLVRAVNRLENRLNVAEPTGGATVDAEARAAINAIRGA